MANHLYGASDRANPTATPEYSSQWMWHRDGSHDDVMIRRSRKRMTLTHLKRHMDRRFDRLEEAKADKADLRRYATKDYIRRRFATKDDLSALSSRVDARFGSVDNQFREVTRRLDSLNGKIDSVLKIAQQSLDLATQTHKDCFHVLHEHEDRLQVLEGRTGL